MPWLHAHQPPLTLHLLPNIASLRSPAYFLDPLRGRPSRTSSNLDPLRKRQQKSPITLCHRGCNLHWFLLLMLISPYFYILSAIPLGIWGVRGSLLTPTAKPRHFKYCLLKLNTQIKAPYLKRTTFKHVFLVASSQAYFGSKG